MLKFISSSFILTVFLIVSCAPKPKILPEERTPQNVLKCALKNQMEFETFASIMNLKLKGEKAKSSGTIEFFYKSPDLISFYPRSFWGANAFKAKAEDDSLTLYFPNDNQFYVGSFSEFDTSVLWGLKIDLKTLLKVIIGEDDWSEENVLYRGQEEKNFIYESEDQRWLKRYWIDSERCRITKSLWTDNDRGEVYKIEYKNFVSFQDVELAKIIEVKSTAGELAKIKFTERKFNLPIPDKKFQLIIPPDAERVTFEPKQKQ